MCSTLVRICVCKIEILKQVQSCTFLIPETHKKKLCKDFDPCNKIVPGDLFAFYSSSGKSPGTIRPLAKPFSRFILPIGQVAWNNYTTRETLFAFYSSTGRSPETIRPLAKFFAFFYHRAGCPKQFDPFQKTTKTKTKTKKQKKMGHRPNDLFLDFYISL